MAALDEKITALAAQVERDRTVNGSAIALMNGIQARIDAAVAEAKAAGATDAQLQSLTDLSTALGNQQDALAAAVAANTPGTGGGGPTP